MTSPIKKSSHHPIRVFLRNDEKTSAPHMTLKQQFWSFANNNDTDFIIACKILLQARKSLFIGAVSGLLMACLLLFILLPATKSSVTIAPTKALNSGISMPTSSRNVAILRALTQSNTSSNMIYFEEFINMISAVPIAQHLRNNQRIINGLNADRRIKLPARQHRWSAEKISAYIQDNVKINKNPNTALITLEYWHPHPEFGQYFLQQLHHTADNAIKNREQIIAQKRKDYLSQQIRETLNTDHKRILNQLLSEQEHLLMLSGIDEPFAAKTIAAPSHFYKAQWPSKPLLLLCCILLGVCCGIVYHLIIEKIKFVSPR